MNASEPRKIEWHTSALKIDFIEDANGVICVRSFLPADMDEKPSASNLFDSSELPLVNVKLAGEGHTSTKTAKSLIGGCLSHRLKYRNHTKQRLKDREALSIYTRDDATGIEVAVYLVIYHDVPVLRASATITNTSADQEHVVTQLSSFAIGGLTTGAQSWFDEYKLSIATNGWFREAQWSEHSLPDLGIDSDGICELPDGHTASQAVFGLSNHGSFSTGSHLAMGFLRAKSDDDCWLWQVEHNGSWRWEVGDFKDSIYLAAGGPTAVDHGWRQKLSAGQSFTTVPIACARVHGGIELAFRAITDYRRKIRRPHSDNETLPIIFNDYMNCLMGDPDETKIEALLTPVAKTGAEYFVIDAGWYADDSNWWDDVGLWQPSKKRFPSGFQTLLQKIKAAGLTPGLWLEPEVVGVRSVVATRLPDTAFFQECGRRIVERGRFQLDYRHAEVRRWMDSVIHDLVDGLGVGYFKFDYNIEVVQGTDVDGLFSAGAAHLEHQRAYLLWVRSLLDRYPGLVIENCSSGAQRMDYAMLSVHPIQSTSDQQDPALYAAIAAAVPTAVAPEQSATWAYPQAEWSDEMNALTVVNSLLGRVHLSGNLDKLSPRQFGLVAQGMAVYEEIRHDLKSAHATWPLGLPKWHDPWICLGMITARGDVYLSVWRRGGAEQIDIDLNSSIGRDKAVVEVLYPLTFKTDLTWDADRTVLTVSLPNTTCARLLKLRRI